MFIINLPPCCTCKRHLIRSPGAMTEVVKIPENAPAQNNLLFDSGVSSSFCNNFFPTPKPKKLIAKIGATPAIGAVIPL